MKTHGHEFEDTTIRSALEKLEARATAPEFLEAERLRLRQARHVFWRGWGIGLPLVLLVTGAGINWAMHHFLHMDIAPSQLALAIGVSVLVGAMMYPRN